MRPVESLTAYDRNARKHSPDQIEKIAASIAEFGFNAPVLVDAAGVIIAGHGRLEAARRIGLKQVPVVPLTHLSDAQRKAYILADNRIALDATWDTDLLAEELSAIEADGLGLDLVGFSQAELDALLAGDPPDAAGGGGGGGIEEAPAGKYTEQYGVIVICRDERDQQETYETLKAQGRAVKVVTT